MPPPKRIKSSGSVACEEELRLLRKFNLRVRLLRALVFHPSPLNDLQQLLNELCSEQLLTAAHLETLLKEAEAQKGKFCISKEKLELVRESAREFRRIDKATSKKRGTSFVPLLYLKREHNELVDDVTVPVRLVCQFVTDQSKYSATIPELSVWEKGLHEIAAAVSRSVVVAAGKPFYVPNADPNWCNELVWDIHPRPSECTWQICGDDRSYELGAAMAVISAVYDTPLPMTWLATGLVDDQTGEILPLEGNGRTEIIRSKCKTIASEFPRVDQIFVAPEDEEAAREALPANCNAAIVKVLHLEDVARHVLGNSALNFKGRTRETLQRRVRKAITFLATAGMGSRENFDKSLQSELFRETVVNRICTELLLIPLCLAPLATWYVYSDSDQLGVAHFFYGHRLDQMRLFKAREIIAFGVWLVLAVFQFLYLYAYLWKSPMLVELRLRLAYTKKGPSWSTWLNGIRIVPVYVASFGLLHLFLAPPRVDDDMALSKRLAIWVGASFLAWVLALFAFATPEYHEHPLSIVFGKDRWSNFRMELVVSSLRVGLITYFPLFVPRFHFVCVMLIIGTAFSGRLAFIGLAKDQSPSLYTYLRWRRILWGVILIFGLLDASHSISRFSDGFDQWVDEAEVTLQDSKFQTSIFESCVAVISMAAPYWLRHYLQHTPSLARFLTSKKRTR